MAHNLYVNEQGEAAYFGVEQPAWHGLGRTVEGRLTSQEALQAAQLDFDVVKQPLYTGEGMFKDELKRIKGQYATVRTDTGQPLGVVGKRYQVLQNREAFAFFDAIVGEGEAIYETAGVLGDGEIIWIMAKMPEYIRVGKDDIIEKYVTLMNSHDGSCSITAFLNTTRIVCNNTLNVALGEKRENVKIRHTSSAEFNLKQAHHALGIANQLSLDLQDAFNFMSSKPVTAKQTDKFLNKLFPDPEDEQARNYNKTRRNNILKALEKGAGCDMKEAKGTWWGVYNGLTYELDHMRNYADDTVKLKSIWFGSGADTRQKTFDAIMAEIN